VVRGLAFGGGGWRQIGHPGGSSSKAEQVLTLLASGTLGFDARHPKNPGRDRIVWSAGHCTPLFHAVVALVYDTLRSNGVSLAAEAEDAAVYPEELAHFRRFDGLAATSSRVMRWPIRPLALPGTDFRRRWLCRFASFLRLPAKAFVIAGDAETEEGMSYEARNLASNLGVRNLLVTLDYNNFGIDGPITEVLPSPYLNHWFAAGWNMIEVDGHNIRELACAYRLADQGFGAGRPTW